MNRDRVSEFGGIMRLKTVLDGIGFDLLKLTVNCRVQSEYFSRYRILPLRSVAALSVVVFTVLAGSPVHGDQLMDLAKKAGMKILSEGESSADSQKKTAQSIPLSQLTPANRQRAQKIIDSCSQYRRLPSLQYSIDEPMYRYLLQHPDVAVSTWRVMGISRFEMWQTGPKEYEAKAVDGSEGIADILYQDAGQMLFICEGNYHNVLLPRPLEASALIWFRAQYAPNQEGTHVVTQRADVFVRFPSAGFSTVAKMLTPVTNGMMDRNLFEVSLYSSMMSRAVRDEPEWVVHVADQMDGVLPQRRGELIDIARTPRKTATFRPVPGMPVTSVDRSVIMSPQLQFFDPPKDGSTAVNVTSSGGASPIRTAELSGKMRATGIKPVTADSAASPSASGTANNRVSKQGAAQTESKKSQSDDEFVLQPVVPPVGSTATDPAGSSPTLPGTPKR
jgi:hypothetical protein